jgi:two-component system cell cycle sensor histidine kinase PleC
MRLAAGAAGAKSVSLVESAPEAPVMVRADVRAFRQILNNIVGNAIKFTPADGRVKVTASRDDGALVIDTEDTGPGFPKAGRAKLGTAYERGANGALAEGTGLGLMLAQSLAALHGGAVSVHDGEGGGALVRVRLPILAEP